LSPEAICFTDTFVSTINSGLIFTVNGSLVGSATNVEISTTSNHFGDSGAYMTGTLGIREAAVVMKIHPKTVYGLIESGALRAGKIGRAYVMLEIDVMRYVENVINLQTTERFRNLKR
jgi:excisionase family DNA binding protein